MLKKFLTIMTLFLSCTIIANAREITKQEIIDKLKENESTLQTDCLKATIYSSDDSIIIGYDNKDSCYNYYAADWVTRIEIDGYVGYYSGGRPDYRTGEAARYYSDYVELNSFETIWLNKVYEIVHELQNASGDAPVVKPSDKRTISITIYNEETGFYSDRNIDVNKCFSFLLIAKTLEVETVDNAFEVKYAVLPQCYGNGWPSEEYGDNVKRILVHEKDTTTYNVVLENIQNRESGKITISNLQLGKTYEVIYSPGRDTLISNGGANGDRSTYYTAYKVTADLLGAPAPSNPSTPTPYPSPSEQPVTKPPVIEDVEYTIPSKNTDNQGDKKNETTNVVSKKPSENKPEENTIENPKTGVVVPIMSLLFLLIAGTLIYFKSHKGIVIKKI